MPGYQIALHRRGGAAGRRGGDLARPVGPAGRTHGRLPGRPQPERLRDARRPLPHRRRRGCATPRATSPTSGRADDVFKSSDYRISPFELESALIEHDAVAEAAVVPSADPVEGGRAQGLHHPQARARARPGSWRCDIFKFIRRRLAPYKRVRRIEFSDLPKTISGKIRRVQLRALEKERRARGERGTARVLAGGVPRAEGLTRTRREPCRSMLWIGPSPSPRTPPPRGRTRRRNGSAHRTHVLHPRRRRRREDGSRRGLPPSRRRQARQPRGLDLARSTPIPRRRSATSP